MMVEHGRTPTPEEARPEGRGPMNHESPFSAALLGRVLSGAALLVALTLLPAPNAAGDEALTAEQKRAVERVIRELLQEHPEVVVNAIRAYQQKEQQRVERKTRTALSELHAELASDPDTPVGGNPEGDVTMVEFFDYRCAFCKRVFPSVNELIEADGNIRYVYKEFPILGDDSVSASRAALAAWITAPGRYVAFRNALMETRGRLPTKRIMKIARSVGLDPDALAKAMAEPTVDALIQRNFALASALNISGTPAFVIGDRVVRGAIDLETMRRLIAEAREG